MGFIFCRTLQGEFCLGKRMKTRKFLWGILSGFLYFLLMVLISFCVYHRKERIALEHGGNDDFVYRKRDAGRNAFMR